MLGVADDANFEYCRQETQCIVYVQHSAHVKIKVLQMRLYNMVLSCFLCLPFLGNACDLVDESEIQSHPYSNSTNVEISHLSSQVSVMNKTLKALQAENAELHAKLLKIDVRNSTYAADISRLNGHPQNAWYSVLLTAVAVIVTVLGAIIAVVAIFGAREVRKAAMNAAISSAKKVAEDSSIQHTKQELPTIAKDYFNGSEFYSLIKRTIEVVAYRGISDNFQEDDEQRRNEGDIGGENV